MKQEEYFNLKALEGILQENQVSKALLFTGTRTFALYQELLLPYLSCDYELCDQFEVNPKKAQVDEMIRKYPSGNDQIIIAFGGGSAIDFAKLYKYFTKSTLPLVAIPTTAGTGSEATQFAVYYEGGEKQSLDEAAVLPEYSILDARLLLKAPAYLRACSAIDAYCQAIESYWAVQSTEESQQYAKQAILLAKEYIVPFVCTQDEQASQQMALASNFAGKAINISRTTAAHALSYKITSRYGLPHGHAVALSMADLLEANSRCDEQSCIDARGASYVQSTVQQILNLLNIDDFSAYWNALLDELGLSRDFNQLGISDKESLIHGVNQDRLKNNPKDLSNDLSEFWQHQCLQQQDTKQ